MLLNKIKHAKEIKAIQAAIEAVKAEKWGKKIPPGVKVCLRDGSEKPELEGYGPEIMFVNASSKKRPRVVDRDLTDLAEEDGKPYAGCVANVAIRLWAQDNQYGKRVNCQLRAVQFVADGDPFGEKPFDVEKGFEAISDEEAAASIL